MDDIDETDRGILQILQSGRPTNQAIGDRVGVSSTTVSDRISDLEDRGVIREYTVLLDYEKAGLPHHFLLYCTVPVADRARLAEESLRVHGVVTVREIMATRRNLCIEIVGGSSDGITETVAAIERLGVEIDRSHALKREYRRPFDGFGSADVRD